MVKSINEILKYLLGISKCTKLPGKNKKGKKTKTNKQIHMFTYWTYLHIGNNDNYLFKIFSFFFFLEKLYNPHGFKEQNCQNNTNKNEHLLQAVHSQMP